MRSIEEIQDTGAAWVTEAELAMLCQRAEAAEAKLEQARIDRDAAVADAVSIGQESKRMEAELARLREAGQRCMKISVGFAAAGIVGHAQILDVMGAALAPEVKP